MGAVSKLENRKERSSQREGYEEGENTARQIMRMERGKKVNR